MTRKEMISYCVDDQIARGIIKAENRVKHINLRLNGSGLVKKMPKSQCERWYNEVVAMQKETKAIS